MTQTIDPTAVQAPTKILINGEWVEPASGKYYDNVNPIDRRVDRPRRRVVRRGRRPRRQRRARRV